MKEYTLQQYIDTLLYDEKRRDLLDKEPKEIYEWLAKMLKERKQMLIFIQNIGQGVQCYM